MNRYIYLYLACDLGNKSSFSGIAQLENRIINQDDLEKLMDTIRTQCGFDAKAITSLSFLGMENENTR
ncbi:hypothetical protein ABRP55_20410 [Pectobacterium zantedeschiae]|uniref:hypothetical protein n=1 Tax=Pectobacterium zantedeschiae TaxID=2034769 RepID=UPI0032EC9B48